MRRDPMTALASDRLIDAVTRMSDRDIRHLPVVDADGCPIGMLSDRDVRSAVGDPVRAMGVEGSRRRLEVVTVGDAMRHYAVVVPTDASAADVAGCFVRHHVGAIPVVEGHRLVGIISYVDLLRAATFASRSNRSAEART